jgi:hypothetical protein
MVAGIWPLGLVSLAVTVFFVSLMFIIERGAEGDGPA